VRGVQLFRRGYWSLHLSSEVRRLRRRRSWTQADLAAVSGVTQRTISAVETSEHPVASLTVARIAEAFDSTPDALLCPPAPGSR
jgi:transcriptional regulator with XRE-family HTH domain